MLKHVAVMNGLLLVIEKLEAMRAELLAIGLQGPTLAVPAYSNTSLRGCA
jgi:hypothetical protein